MSSFKIDATPQKRLFLSIIADYGLLTSVCELVDNALDHWLQNDRKKPLEINVILNSDRGYIRVSDNSGGVPKDNLELLVSPGASGESNGYELIGNFGVGGKRAGIALGERVRIRTRCGNQLSYEIELNQEWLENELDWNLEAVEISDISEGSTEVHITELRQGLSLEDIEKMAATLGEVYANFLGADCVITLNDKSVLKTTYNNWSYPPEYRPKFSQFQIAPEEGKPEKVSIAIEAGLISDRDPAEGNYGVYFYCNERLILAHSKAPEVGYFKGKAGTPHPDASLCRVIVNITGKPEHMPWTSNKAGINWSHPTFTLIHDRVVELTKYFTDVSRRTKSDREGQIYSFSSGELEPIDLTSSDSLKRIVALPTPRGRKKAYANRLLDQNTHITKAKPWTLGLVESMSMFEVLLGKPYESRNRLGLIILDSNLEIGMKEFLVNGSNYYSDEAIGKLFKQRHLVVAEVKKSIQIEDALWQKTSHYNNLRNKLIHERATVQITDTQLVDYQSVVESILAKLFSLNFSRD